MLCQRRLMSKLLPKYYLSQLHLSNSRSHSNFLTPSVQESPKLLICLTCGTFLGRFKWAKLVFVPLYLGCGCVEGSSPRGNGGSSLWRKQYKDCPIPSQASSKRM